MNRKYRITSPTRFMLFVTIALLVLISTTVTVIGSERSDRQAIDDCTEIRIQSGDTLWDLANEYGPADQDVRKVVQRICKINEITPEELMPGQKIKIPKYL